MKNYKISKLLKDSAVSKFVTRKWIEVNDLLGSRYSVNKIFRKVIYTYAETDLCEYNDVFIVVKWRIDLEVSGNNNEIEKGIELKILLHSSHA